jgi:hypothetical protein
MPIAQLHVFVDDLLDLRHSMLARPKKAGGRYTVGFLLRLPALFSDATGFARDCNDMVKGGAAS